MSRPGKETKLRYSALLTPPHPPLPGPPDGCKFPFFPPTSGFSAQLLETHRQRRGEGWTEGRGAPPAGLDGRVGGEGGGRGPSVGVLLGPTPGDRVGEGRCAGLHPSPREPRSPALGAAGPRVTKGLRGGPPLRPLPRPAAALSVSLLAKSHNKSLARS